MLHVPLYDPRGYETEDRLFSALAHHDGPKPDFLWHVERAPPRLDLLGIDGIAHIHYPGESHLTEVPFQIKSSAYGISRYYRTHMGAYMARVPIIVIKPWFERETICRIFYQKIEKVWNHRWKYDEYLAKSLSVPLNPQARRWLRYIQYNELARSWLAHKREDAVL